MRPLRIVVDARWTRIDTYDGVSRFGAQLIEALHDVHPVTMLIHDARQLRLLPGQVPWVQINSPFSPKELLLARTIHRLGADVVFSPLQVIGGGRRRYALILTLHDLIYYRHPTPPGFLPGAVRLLWWLYHQAYWPQRLLLDRADAVVTVSETTERLIAEHRLTRRPVAVVPNAPGRPAPGGQARQGVAAGSRELVYMGSFMPYKNVETLISGMAFLPGFRLHLVSPITPEREAELTRLTPAGADVRFWRGISDPDYSELLARAHALVTASRDEGFGLPVIEAMHAGTPVVCSDLPIMREVTGGHALLFHPSDAGGFASAVQQLTSPELRAELVEAGRQHASGFTWRESADRLLRLIHEVGG